MFDNMGDMEEAFNEHLQDIQNPNNPLNRNFNVAGTSDVCMSLKQKVNEPDDKPSQSDNTQDDEIFRFL